MRKGIHKRNLSVLTKKIKQGDGLMVLAFSGMKNFVKINRLIESQCFTVTILVEKNRHGLGDNKQQVCIMIRFSLISLKSFKARLCFTSFFENKATKKLVSQ